MSGISHLCGDGFLYASVILAMFFGRIAHFRPGDDACVIGLKPTTSLPLLSYDLEVAIASTLTVFKPHEPDIANYYHAHPGASAAALTTSTLFKGHELGWLCLGSCGADVVLNAAALFWVTSGRHATHRPNKASTSRRLR
ncbi:hypothetical protein DFH09DRAFT_1311024 [Mycena vulgaris]|nr:hypothetical protein DFH09DRAFT_1311024 [Mycena vulgaris]